MCLNDLKQKAYELRKEHRGDKREEVLTDLAETLVRKMSRIDYIYHWGDTDIKRIDSREQIPLVCKEFLGIIAKKLGKDSLELSKFETELASTDNAQSVNTFMKILKDSHIFMGSLLNVLTKFVKDKDKYAEHKQDYKTFCAARIVHTIVIWMRIFWQSLENPHSEDTPVEKDHKQHHEELTEKTSRLLNAFMAAPSDFVIRLEKALPHHYEDTHKVSVSEPKPQKPSTHSAVRDVAKGKAAGTPKSKPQLTAYQKLVAKR